MDELQHKGGGISSYNISTPIEGGAFSHAIDQIQAGGEGIISYSIYYGEVLPHHMLDQLVGGT